MADTDNKNSSNSKKDNQTPQNKPQGGINRVKDGKIVERRSYSEKATVFENKGTGPGSPNKKKE